MEKSTKPEIIERVEITRRGKTYHGAYTIDDGMITVFRTGATTQVGSHPEKALAKILLAEMVHV